MGFFSRKKKRIVAPEISPELKANLAAQTAALDKQTEILNLSLDDFQATKPKLLARSGFKVGTGEGGVKSLVPLSKQEFLQSLDPIERARTERLLGAFERAEAGDVESFLTSADKKQREDEFKILKENLAGRGINVIGDDPATAFSTSTAGNQALEGFYRNIGLLAESRTLGQLAPASNISQNIRAGSRFLEGLPAAQAKIGQGFSSVIAGLQGKASTLSEIDRRNAQVAIANQQRESSFLPQIGRIAGGVLGGFIAKGKKGAALGALGQSSLIPFLK